MATLTVELSDELLAKIERTGRPAQEVIVEALERMLNGDLTRPSAAPHEEPSKEEIIRRLEEAGYLEDPSVWDGPDAQAWRDLSEEEKERYLQEVNAMRFSDSPASRYIMENRR